LNNHVLLVGGPMNILNFMDRIKQYDGVAVECDDIKIDYKKLIRDIYDKANIIYQNDMNGKNIFISNKLSYQWIVEYLATILAGATVVIAEEYIRPKIREEIEVYDIEAIEKVSEETKTDFSDIEYKISTIIYTSGTTSLPKPVLLSCDSIFSDIAHCSNVIDSEVIENAYNTIPILPIFIATTFATLAYEGSITKQLPVFLKVILIVLVGHYIWIAILYTIGGIVSGKNPWSLLKHYGPAYMTAVGTMSSAATLPVSLKCVRKSGVLDEEITNFAIPLGATTHLCGSVLTETFFVMVVAKILYGAVPPVGTMVLFILLLGVFAVGAPGVPGGTVLASLGLIISVLGFDETGTALMITIFALQDSFGTACNITGDGALALILNGIFKKKQA